jgi:hypothetical protein
MLLFNSNRKPADWDVRFSQCMSMNNWRNHDRRVCRRKYPFASIHFLLAIVAANREINLPASASGPLLHADGTYKLLLQYTENAWDWLRYMGVQEAHSPLHTLFHNPDMTVYSLMTQMLEFWRRRDEHSRTGQRGDRIAITERGGDGALVNLVPNNADGNLSDYDTQARVRNEAFLAMLGELTGWPYRPDHWSWADWRVVQFEKGIDSEMTNLTRYGRIMDAQPLSWVIPSNNRCEFTVVPPEAAALFD